MADGFLLLCHITIFVAYLCLSDNINYPEWHYDDSLEDGPSNWYNIEGGELCAHSKQSPIMIDPLNFKNMNDSQCNKTLQWMVDDTMYNWSISHQGEAGHTIEVQNMNATNNIYFINTHQTDKKNSSLHSHYIFDSFHVHWGPGPLNGSEHIYNNNITTTLEIHFVHYNANYNGTKAAVNGWHQLTENGEYSNTLAVVSFLFQEVENPEFEYNIAADAILLEMATDPIMHQVWKNETERAYLSFSIIDLVNISDFRLNYYRYDGSLTTPPCTPAVSWNLAQNAIKIRQSTMDLFRIKTKLWRNATGAIDADINFRPIQSNPSCINTCYDEYCPPQQRESKLPFWFYLCIAIAVGVCVFIGIAICWCCCKKKRKHEQVTELSMLSESINPKKTDSKYGLLANTNNIKLNEIKDDITGLITSNLKKITNKFLFPTFTFSIIVCIVIMILTFFDFIPNLYGLSIICGLTIITAYIGMYGMYKFGELDDYLDFTNKQNMEYDANCCDLRKSRMNMLKDLELMEERVDTLEESMIELNQCLTQFDELKAALSDISDDSKEVEDVVDALNAQYHDMKVLAYKKEEAQLLVIYYRVLFARDKVFKEDDYKRFIGRLNIETRELYDKLGGFEAMDYKNDGVVDVHEFVLITEKVLEQRSKMWHIT